MKTMNHNCGRCGKEFEADRKDRIYCSKECYDKHRKEYHKEYSANWMRLKRGTYDNMVRKLVKAGYKVISPEAKNG